MFSLNKSAAAVALGLALAAVASPSLAQRSETPMSNAREQALRECSAAAAKYKQYTWGHQESESIAPAWPITANRNSA